MPHINWKKVYSTNNKRKVKNAMRIDSPKMKNTSY